VTGQRNGLAFRAALDGDHPDGPGLGGGWYWLVAARDRSPRSKRREIRGLNIGAAFRKRRKRFGPELAFRALQFTARPIYYDALYSARGPF
jgi:hypothetical protein